MLAENVKALMAAKKLKQQHVAALAGQRGHKIDQTTVGRVARAEIPTTVEKIDALAAAFGIEAWQLLVQNLDPARLPKLALVAVKTDAVEQHPLAKVREGHRLTASRKV